MFSANDLEGANNTNNKKMKIALFRIIIDTPLIYICIFSIKDAQENFATDDKLLFLEVILDNLFETYTFG
ncbi:hypothetical protein CDB3_22015 [Bacillus sp. CDB3]|nr:hypothetical protein CDB3_22015 [Bacillus sp. CDB3]